MRSQQELTCREMVELMTEYLEGAMVETDRVRFESHLATCEGCTNYLEQIREVIRLTGMLTEQQVPAEARDKLLDAFRDWKRG